MALTGKKIGELTYLSGATSSTLFPAELNGVTYRIPFSGMTGVSGSSGTSGSSGITGSSGLSGTSGSSGSSGTSGVNGTSGSSGVSPTVNYTIYKVLLSYSVGGFTVTQLENTIGDGSNASPADIQWSNPSNGVLRATKTGAFSSSNILILTQSISVSGSVYLCTGVKSQTNFLSFSLFLHDGTQTSTPYFSNLPIEIRIY